MNALERSSWTGPGLVGTGKPEKGKELNMVAIVPCKHSFIARVQKEGVFEYCEYCHEIRLIKWKHRRLARFFNNIVMVKVVNPLLKYKVWEKGKEPRI